MNGKHHDGNMVRSILVEHGLSIKWLSEATGKDRSTWGRKLKCEVIEETYLFLIRNALKINISSYFPRLKKFSPTYDPIVALDSFNDVYDKNISPVDVGTNALERIEEEIIFLKNAYKSNQFIIRAKDRIIMKQEEELQSLHNLIKGLNKKIDAIKSKSKHI